MAENRQCNRITYVAGGTLQYRDTIFSCRLENLSMFGALVTIRTKPDFLPGNICVLKLYDELVGRDLTFETLIAHQALDHAGLKFINNDVETQISLEMIMERESNINRGVGDNAHPSGATLQPYSQDS